MTLRVNVDFNGPWTEQKFLVGNTKHIDAPPLEVVDCLELGMRVELFDDDGCICDAVLMGTKFTFGLLDARVLYFELDETTWRGNAVW